MRHGKKGRKLGLVKRRREALKKSLVRALMLHERMKTTATQAKEIRPMAEKIISRAKNDTLVNRRYLARYFDKSAVRKIFEIAAKYGKRSGGYTRIAKLGRRQDGAQMAIIEFV